MSTEGAEPGTAHRGQAEGWGAAAPRVGAAWTGPPTPAPHSTGPPAPRGQGGMGTEHKADPRSPPEGHHPAAWHRAEHQGGSTTLPPSRGTAGLQPWAGLGDGAGLEPWQGSRGTMLWAPPKPHGHPKHIVALSNAPRAPHGTATPNPACPQRTPQTPPRPVGVPQTTGTPPHPTRRGRPVQRGHHRAPHAALRRAPTPRGLAAHLPLRRHGNRRDAYVTLAKGAA